MVNCDYDGIDSAPTVQSPPTKQRPIMMRRFLQRGGFGAKRLVQGMMGWNTVHMEDIGSNNNRLSNKLGAWAQKGQHKREGEAKRRDMAVHLSECCTGLMSATGPSSRAGRGLHCVIIGGCGLRCAMGYFAVINPWPTGTRLHILQRRQVSRAKTSHGMPRCRSTDGLR